MTEVLTIHEIDQLLSAINAGDTEPEALSAADSRTIKIYDFKRPDKFSREQIRMISIIHETFSRLTTTALSAQLRSMAHVHVASVDQLTYEEFIRSIPAPTTLAIVSMNSLKGNAILEIDPAITFSIIDRICGGCGVGIENQHELTDIETSIMENIIVYMLGNIRESWSGVIDLRPRLYQIETNPQFAQIVPPTEMVVLVTLEAKVGNVEGLINICIPYLTIEPIIGRLSIQYYYREPQDITSLNYSIRESIPIRLSAEILRRDYPIKEILKWDIGTVIMPLRSPASDCCYLRLGDRRVWQCKILPDCAWFPKRITIVNYAEKPFGTEGNDMKMDNVNPLVKDALSAAKMTVSVELGTTLKTVKEVFSMGEGTILELDKLAGEPVDIKANGILFALGEIVVIDENFGVRIIEITRTHDDSAHSEESEPQQPASKPHELKSSDFGKLSEDISKEVKEEST